MPETIESPKNDKLKLVRRLADRRGRRKAGLFATEGEDLLTAGLGAGVRPEFVLASAAVPDGALGLPPDLDPLRVGGELLDDVSVLGSGTRVIAVWAMPGSGGETTVERPCVFLDAVADPGNVGTIMRSAAALCGARVALGPGCADAYSPKATRASAGAVFSHPPVETEVGMTPGPRIGLVAHDGADLDAVIAAAGPPATICLGAEREGLGAETQAACDRLVTIPLQAGAESLNVAATAAIALQRISSAAAHRPASGEGS